jgi:hypothetical protein
MAAVAFIIALIQAWSASGDGPPLWLGASAALGVVAFTKPDLLHRANLVWFRFGLLLHRVVNPLVMGIMFFGVVTPIGLVMRLVGQRLSRSSSTAAPKPTGSSAAGPGLPARCASSSEGEPACPSSGSSSNSCSRAKNSG